MRSGLYRDSISLAMSIFALPFAEEVIGGNQPGDLWPMQPDIHYRLWELLHAVLAPAALTRRACSAAVRTLMLQDRLKKGNLKKLTNHPGYPHGRELAIIQNNVQWHIEQLEDTLVPPSPALLKPNRKRRRGRKPGKTDSLSETIEQT